MKRLLEYWPDERLSSSEALLHPWIAHLQPKNTADCEMNTSASSCSQNSRSSADSKSKCRRRRGSNASTAIDTTQSDVSSSQGQRNGGPLVKRKNSEVNLLAVTGSGTGTVVPSVKSGEASGQRYSGESGPGNRRRRKSSDGDCVASGSIAKLKRKLSNEDGEEGSLAKRKSSRPDSAAGRSSATRRLSGDHDVVGGSVAKRKSSNEDGVAREGPVKRKK